MATPERIIAQSLEEAQRGRFAPAIASLRTLVQRQPRNAQALQALGHVLSLGGQPEQALYMFRRAAEVAPESPPARNNLGVMLMACGQREAAAKEMREAVRLDPGYAIAWAGLTTALMHLRDFDGAEEAGRRACELAPDFAEAYLNRYLAMMDSGRVDDAIAGLRDAHSRFPRHARLHSLLLMGLNYTDAVTPAERTAAHRAFAAGIDLRPARTDPSADRRLRIGFLSGDFAAHSVMYFLEPLLEHLPRERFEVWCYSTSTAADDTTARVRALTQGWVDASSLSDEQIDARIRKDAVDVLVDLGGHTGSGRPMAIARKPAPVIIAAIGYPNTSGLAAVDYRLVDSITDPPGAEPLSTERLLRLDPCFLCYRPRQDGPDATPSAENRPITFGSFNALAKISSATLDAWAAILHQVRDSRMLLKSAGFADPNLRRRFAAAFESRDIDPSRVEMLDQTPSSREHLALYSRVHIALDTFPYNGTTTTCEALWMGVPVVAAMGDAHVSRVSASLLHAAGLPDLVAPSRAEYVTLAVRLAGDAARLRALRSSLRGQLLSSPLCDSQAYAKRFAVLVDDAWRTWCRAPTSKVPA